VTEGNGITIYQIQFPRRDAFRYAKENNAQLISTATDDHCLRGYAALVDEFPKDIDAIFVPASSGALAVGLYEGYKKYQVSSIKYQVPKFFVLQTPRVHPLIEAPRLRTKQSLARAISDVVGKRRFQIRKIIYETNGRGMVVTDQYIRKAMRFLKKYRKKHDRQWGNAGKPSPDGSLSLAGLLHVLETEPESLKEAKRVLCLYTGD